MNDPDLQSHPAIVALRAFFDEMNRWEAAMIRSEADFADMTEAQYKQHFEQGRRSLERIFEAHCHEGTAAERFADAGLNYPSDEPAYDAAREQVVRVSPGAGDDRALVETRQTHADEFQLLYEMVRTAGGWRVSDKRMCRRDNAERWRDWPL